LFETNCAYIEVEISGHTPLMVEMQYPVKDSKHIIAQVTIIREFNSDTTIALIK
jgi:hypothetical protein